MGCSTSIAGSAPGVLPSQQPQIPSQPFSPITLNTVGQFAIIESATPYVNVLRIRGWSEDISGMGTLVKEFSWSVDKATWSYWTTLSQDNLEAISNRLPRTGFFFRFRYTLASIGSVTITNVKLDVELAVIDPNQGWVPPWYICGGLGNMQGNILAQCSGSFNPYLVDPCSSIYQQLVYSIQNMFGLDVVYLRAKPKEDSGDVVFKEWTLYSVENPICTKVLVPDNTFPDPTLQYNPYGIEYEMPFEVHIVKRNFEEVFGKDAAPQSRDIVYFPLIPNRLYEVRSTTPFQDFMMQMTYWKVDLMIYRSKANTYATDAINQMLDEITIDSFEAFGKELEKDTKKITKPQQYDRFLGTNLIDPIRKYVNQDMKIYTIPLANHSTVIAEYHYDLSTVFNPNKNVTGVQYAVSSKFTASDNFGFSCWFKDMKPRFVVQEDPVKLELLVDNKVRLQLQVIRKYKEGQHIQLFRQGKLNFFGKVTEVHNDSLYDIEVHSEILTYLSSINASWINATGWTAKRCFEKVYIDSLDVKDETVKGWKLSSFAERYWIFNTNGTETLFCLPENIGDTWTAMFFNYSALFGQMNISFWKVDDNSRDTNLLSVYSRTVDNIDTTDIDSSINYAIPASNILLTNLRLFNETVEFEKQSLILNQNIIQDSDKLIIADNSIPLQKLAYVGNVK